MVWPEVNVAPLTSVIVMGPSGSVSFASTFPVVRIVASLVVNVSLSATPAAMIDLPKAWALHAWLCLAAEPFRSKYPDGLKGQRHGVCPLQSSSIRDCRKRGHI